MHHLRRKGRGLPPVHGSRCRLCPSLSEAPSFVSSRCLFIGPATGDLLRVAITTQREPGTHTTAGNAALNGQPTLPHNSAKTKITGHWSIADAGEHTPTHTALQCVVSPQRPTNVGAPALASLDEGRGLQLLLSLTRDEVDLLLVLLHASDVVLQAGGLITGLRRGVPGGGKLAHRPLECLPAATPL